MTLVRQLYTELDNTGDHGGRHVFNLSNGNTIAVIRDDNSLGNPKIFVYETPDMVTWTLRATIDPWAGANFNYTAGTLGVQMTATVGPDNDVHIVAKDTDGNDVRYCRMDYADYSVGAWQAVVATAGDDVVRNFDIDVTDGGRAYITTIFDRGPGSPYGFALYSRITGSWASIASLNVHSVAFSHGCETISVGSAVDTVVYAGDTYDQLFIAFGYSQGTTDQGVHVYRADVRITDGALHTALSVDTLGVYDKGDGNPKSGWPEARLARFFRNPANDDEIYLGIMHAEVQRKMHAIRLNVPRAQKSVGAEGKTFLNPTVPLNIGSRYLGMSIGGSSIIFHYGTTHSKFPNKTLMSFTARWDEALDTFIFGPRGCWFLPDGYIAGYSVTMVSSGGQRNGVNPNASMIVTTSKTSTQRRVYGQSIRNLFEAPVQVYPADGSTLLDSTPTVIGRLKYNSTYMQSQQAIEFQIAEDDTFTTGVVTIESLKYIVVDNVDTASVAVAQVGGTVQPADAIVPGTTMYFRGRTIDPFGNVGPWSTATEFIVSHPPTSTNLIPTDGSIVGLLSGDQLMFRWTFVDPSSTDTQSAYQIMVIKNSDSSTILDTGKVISSDNFALLTIPSGHVDESVSWDLKLWDAYDEEGIVSGRVNFMIEEPPVITITSPTVAEVLGTPVPHVEFTVVTSGGATIKSYRVFITQGTSTVFDTGTKAVSDPSGTSYTVDGSVAVFHNLGQYTVHVVAVDSSKFTGYADTVSFSAAWTPPAMPTTVPVIDLTHYSVEDEGYIVVTWDDSGKVADFAMYVLQRQDNLIDSSSTVVEEGEWNDIATIYANDTTYEYHDYLAPGLNYQVGYRLVQGATVFNDIAFSDPGPATYDYPQSGDYWLVDPLFSDGLSGAYKLHHITSDQYTEEYETASYHVIGRGNHTDYGDRLGYNGTLVAQIRNSGSTTARQKKATLESIKTLKRSLYLRTPFGDVKLVSVGDLQVSRIAGVGGDEFCDITIPYQEVGGA